MPKAPHKEKEPYEWKCKACKMTGRAESKADATLVLNLHMYLNHRDKSK